MLTWLRDFFLSKQTFASVAGDALSGVSVIAASPEAMAAITAAEPWAAVAIPIAAYIGGVISGRKTAR